MIAKLFRLCTGDLVSFRDKHGRCVQITVESIAVKSISGKTSDGLRWRVAPSLVEKVA